MRTLRKGRPSFGETLDFIHEIAGTRYERKDTRQGDEHIV